MLCPDPIHHFAVRLCPHPTPGAAHGQWLTQGIKRLHLKTDHLHGIQYILQSSPTELAGVTPSLPKKNVHPNSSSPQQTIYIPTYPQQIICMLTIIPLNIACAF